MNKSQLHNLINRYFEAETSIEEERILRHELASVTAADPLVDEARAVLGLSLATPKATKVKRASGSIAWRIAASLTAAVAIGVAVLVGGIANDNSDQCVAYLNGEKISNEHEVMQQMFAELSEMENASTEMKADISSEIDEISLIISNMQGNK